MNTQGATSVPNSIHHRTLHQVPDTLGSQCEATKAGYIPEAMEEVLTT